MGRGSSTKTANQQAAPAAAMIQNPDARPETSKTRESAPMAPMQNGSSATPKIAFSHLGMPDVQ